VNKRLCSRPLATMLSLFRAAHVLSRYYDETPETAFPVFCV
jgi:hypothetical protein